MNWIIAFLVFAGLCYIVYRIGYKYGQKMEIEEHCNHNSDSDAVKLEAKELAEKIKDLAAKTIKFDPWTKTKIFQCFNLDGGSRCGSYIMLHYVKRGFDTPDEEGYAFEYPDNLELHYNNEEERAGIYYHLQGDTVEEQAEDAARIITGIMQNWKKNSIWWSDSIDEGLPF